MGKSNKLKVALQSQQSRFQRQKKVAKALQAAEERAGHRTRSTKGLKSRHSVSRSPVTVPFKPSDRILLVGEGNFSFAKALICDPPSCLNHLPPQNITATSYDGEEECYAKYPDAANIVECLRKNGARVLFNIDATKLEKVSQLKGTKWDRVVWNFPHAGKGITDQDRNILSNQVLILGFLRSVAPFLATGSIPVIHPNRRRHHSDDGEGSDENTDDAPLHGTDLELGQSGPSRGTVLITLRNVPPYTLWQLSALAKNPPPPKNSVTPSNPKYVQLRSFAFDRSFYKGYEHRMTKGERAGGSGKTGEGGEDRTWEFYLR